MTRIDEAWVQAEPSGALIYKAEEILDRAREIAQSTDERVHTLLDDSDPARTCEAGSAAG